MKVFVDANVLVYARDASEITKQPRALRWMDHLWKTSTGCLSTQILNEFYAAATGKLDPGLSVSEARADVAELMASSPAPIDVRVVRRAWLEQDTYGSSWWDALVVAAAKSLEADALLTEDLSDGQHLDGILVIDPFRYDPVDLDGLRGR